jgi:hypothetical protein
MAQRFDGAKYSETDRWLGGGQTKYSSTWNGGGSDDRHGLQIWNPQRKLLRNEE